MAYVYRGSNFKVDQPLAPPRPRKPRSAVAQCGTIGGVSKHRKQGEPICTACADANREYKKEWRARVRANQPPKEPRPRKPLPPKQPPRIPGACGTLSGYRRHRRANEPKCRPCKDAYNAHNRAQNAAKNPRKGWTGDKCGTLNGHTAHNYYRTPMCAPCKTAKAEYDAARYLIRKAARDGRVSLEG